MSEATAKAIADFRDSLSNTIRLARTLVPLLPSGEIQRRTRFLAEDGQLTLDRMDALGAGE